MAINTSSTATGAAKSGYIYADLTFQEGITVPQGAQYLGTLTLNGASLGIKSMMLGKSSSAATKSDTLVISYADPGDSTQTLNAKGTLDATLSTDTKFVYTFTTGASQFAGNLELLGNFDSNQDLIGFYVPVTDRGLVFGSGTLAPDAPVASLNAPGLTTVSAADNSLTVLYDASVKTVNEDANNMGARLFFNAAASRNVVNQQVGVNQIDVTSSAANFAGGQLVVQILTPQTDPKTMAFVGVGQRSSVFKVGSDNVLYYYPDASYSGASVALQNTSADTQGINLYEKGDPINSKPLSELSSIAIGKYSNLNSLSTSKIAITFNEQATVDIVEMLLSHIGLSAFDRTTIGWTQDWSGIPANLEVKFSLTQSSTSAAVTFTKTLAMQSVEESSAPTVEIARTLNVVDELKNPDGLSFATNLGKVEVNVDQGQNGGNKVTVADKEGDFSGGTVKVAFLQGASSFMRLGIGNKSGVFKVENGLISYASDALYAGKDIYDSNGTLTTPVYTNTHAGTNWKVIGNLDSTHQGKKGDSLLIKLNQNATTSIVQALVASLYVAVRDPDTGLATSNWASAAGDKLIKVEVTDAAGHSGFDTVPVRVVSHAENDDGKILGSGGNDSLSGTPGSDTIDGGNGNDYLTGLAGDDSIIGGGGQDTLVGGEGKDTLYGGGWQDTYDLRESTRARDTVKIEIYDQGAKIEGFDTSSDSTADATSTNDVLALSTTAIADDTSAVVKGVTVGQFAQHSIKSGIITFKDRLGSDIVLNQDTNKNDLLAYLWKNLNTVGVTVGAAFDSDNNGKADSLAVFQNTADPWYTFVILSGLVNVTLGKTPGRGVVQIGDGFGPENYVDSTSTTNIVLSYIEDINTFDVSGIQIKRFTGLLTQEVLSSSSNTVSFKATKNEKDLILTFDTPLTSEESFILLPIDRTKQFVTDSAGNIKSIVSDTGNGAAFALPGNTTLDISGATVGYNLWAGKDAGHHTLIGNSGNNKMGGAEGSDTLQGGAGNDTLFGNGGDDRLEGGDGNDKLNGGDGSDSLLGGSGVDTLIGGVGNDTLDGGLGKNYADYGDSKSADWKVISQVTAGLTEFVITNLGTGEKDILRNIDEIWFDHDWKPLKISSGASANKDANNWIDGTEFDDAIDSAVVFPGQSTITARDWIGAGAGNDVIKAGAGGDDIGGDGGNDTIDGGSTGLAGLLAVTDQNYWQAEDRARYSGPASRYSITQLVDANGSVTGVSGTKYYIVKDLRAGSPDGTDTVFNVDALQFSDKQLRLTPNVWLDRWDPETNQQSTTKVRAVNLTGTQFADKMGALDADTAIIFKGTDRLNGGDGNDTLMGGAGGDTLRGDKGNDSLDGGANRDTYTQYGDPNGANGVDVAEYAGNADRYTVTRNQDGTTFTVTDSKGDAGEGTDTLTNIEVLRFADKQVNLQVVKQVSYQYENVNGQWVQTQKINNVNWDGTAFNDSIDTSTVQPTSVYEQWIRSGAGDDVIKTGVGKDNIEGGEGNDTIDGGANGTTGNTWQDWDVAHYAGNQSRFTISQKTGQPGTFIVEDKLDASFGGLGKDELTNIERLQFKDAQVSLVVEFNPNAWSNNINGTGFDDVIQSDALTAKAKLDAPANTVVLQTSGDATFSYKPGSSVSLVEGGKYWIAFGWLNWDGSFNPNMRWNSQTNTSEPFGIVVTADANGNLTSNDSVNSIPSGGNSAFQLFAANAQGQKLGTTPLMPASFIQTFSANDYIQPGKGDDVVYAGAGGDTMLDAQGNDFYDGGANGTTSNMWQNQDAVQFAGIQKRYKIDTLSYESLNDSNNRGSTRIELLALKAKIDAGYPSNPPSTIVRVVDRMPDVLGGDGVNYIVGVEQLRFQDTTVDLSPNINKWAPDPAWGNSYVGSNNYNGGLLNEVIDARDHDLATVADPVNGFYSTKDNINGGVGNDTLYGGAGGDSFQGGKGNDLIDGGANGSHPTDSWNNMDSVNYSGKLSRYDITLFRVATANEIADSTVTKYNDTGYAISSLPTSGSAYVISKTNDPLGFVVVQDKYPDDQGGDGRDVLRNIERIDFNGTNLQLDSSVTDSNADGTMFDDVIYAPNLDVEFNANGRAGNDYIRGGNKRDDLSGGTGNDTIDGGGNPALPNPWDTWSSYDVVRYSAPKNQFTVERSIDTIGTVTGTVGQVYFRVSHLVPESLGGLGTDIVFNVERLQFLDAASGNWDDVPLQMQIVNQNEGSYVDYNGTAFADIALGGVGIDHFVAGPGNDTFDGGGGTGDYAGFIDGVRRYEISLFRDGAKVATYNADSGQFASASGTENYGDGDTVQVKDLLPDDYGGDGTDTFIHVENLQFNDFWFNLSNAGIPSPIDVGVDVTIAANTSYLSGNNGNDKLTGSAGNDNLDGRAGNDTIDGGAEVADQENPWNSGDSVSYNAPRARFDIIAQAGGSFLVVDFASIKNLSATDFTNGHLNASAYAADRLLSGVGYGLDTLIHIEHLNFNNGRVDLVQTQSDTPQSGIGSGGIAYTWMQSTISGTSQSEVIRGTTHRDYIDPRGGNDTVDGGVESSSFIGDSWQNSDEVRYQGSVDRYDVSFVKVRVSGSGDASTYTVLTQEEAAVNSTGELVTGVIVQDSYSDALGGSGKDLLVNVEFISFNDKQISLKPQVYKWFDTNTNTNNLNINGTALDDLLDGGPGNDWLQGADGDDSMVGGAGGDEFTGGAGDDTIVGGANSAPDQNGWTRTDTAHYDAPFARFEISNVVDSTGKSWLQVKDKVPSVDPNSLGTDWLDGVENLAFNDRWIGAGVQTNKWTDWQGITTVNSDGTVLGDVIVGGETPSSVGGKTVTLANRDSMRGNEGNDVLIGNGNGDDLTGGQGNDVLDGGSNGTSGNQWQDQDVARFSGDFSRYERSVLTFTGSAASGTISLNGVQTATVSNSVITYLDTTPADIVGLITLANTNLKLFDGQHATGILIRDLLDSELGGDGADLLFNIEQLQFRDKSKDQAMSAQASDWNNDGKLDGAQLIGTDSADTLNFANLVTMTSKSAQDLQTVNVYVDLKDGDDVYKGSTGGESINPGKGNDYIDGGGSTSKDQWGNKAQDNVRFEGNYDRYVVIDVSLSQKAGNWIVSSARDPSLGCTMGTDGGLGTLTSSDAAVLKLLKMDQAGMDKAINALIANRDTSASVVSGWLVADRLPTDLEGSGVDAVTRIDSIAFNDRWIPLSLQIWLNRAWTDEYKDIPYDKRPIMGSGVEGSGSADRIGVDYGNSTEYNFQGDDWIRAGAGNDTIKAGAGSDGITGGAGDDYIDGGSNGGKDNWGNVRGDSVQYEDSFDTYTVTANTDGSVTVTDSRADGTGTDTLVNIEQLSFRDRWINLAVNTWIGKDQTGKVVNVGLNGSLLGEKIDASADEYPGISHNLNGNEGNDTLIGGSGADRFDGGAGDDSMVGGANGRDAWGNPGMDIVNYNGSVSRFTIEYSTDGKTWSTKNPGAGDLIVRVSDSLADADGGVGVDILTGMEALSFNDKWISLQTTRSAVDVDGDGKPDQFQIIGTASADTLVGDITNDQLVGGEGDDTLIGGSGADTLKGGAGNDSLDGGANGKDASGKVLFDVAEYEGKQSDYTVTLNPDEISYTVISSAEGSDWITGIEALQFSDGYVRLQKQIFAADTDGNGVIDMITIQGSDLASLAEDLAPGTSDPAGARYQIYAGNGNDKLTGSGQDDYFQGDGGNDTIVGGAGNDSAKFSGKYSDYSVEFSTDNKATWTSSASATGYVRVTATAQGNTDGIDLLTGIENLVFADQMIRLKQTTITSKTADTDGDKKVDTVYWTGTSGNDPINGQDDVKNVMEGGTGNDTLVGKNRADTFTPGSGNDTIDGGGSPEGQGDSVVYAGKMADYNVKIVSTIDLALSSVTSGTVLSVVLGNQTVNATSASSMATTLNNLKTAIQAAFSFSATAQASQIPGSSIKVNTASSVSLEKGMTLKLGDTDFYGITNAVGVDAKDAQGSVTGKDWTLTLDKAYTQAPSSLQLSVYRVGTDFSASSTIDSSNKGHVQIAISGANVGVDSTSSEISISRDNYVEVKSKLGGETDTLRNIETLVFDDKSVDLAASKSVTVSDDTYENIYKIAGTQFSDMLLSTNLDEVFQVGKGDHIVLADGSGKDTVKGFVTGTGGTVLTINLGLDDTDGLNGKAVDTAVELQGKAVQQGNDVLLDLGAGNSILLVGVQQSDLTSANFEFVHTV